MQEHDHTTLDRDDAPITAAKKVDAERTLFAESVTINRPAQELYDFWRNPGNLVQVVENIVSIEPLGPDRSRWTVKAPAGREVSWESVITKDVPGEEIYWQSAEGAEVANSGRIEFQDAGRRGTVVRAVIAYDAPGGTLGRLIAKIAQREPRIQTRRDLHRFKQLMETGEIATGARNRRILNELRGEEQ
ncbi:SRPBCC family protein [Altererythrobacter sp. Root672]|uniref:SRPBCC family protein n=1 Tax=Altererythrobacter sp. Root672 TaxID=1736584 RepID=UPI0006FEC59E|nr:SRPBCC family protein [Altererythrobacter sp. Root672]KRA83979.1 cyclase [Altererythrobacter sp. Root672]